MKYTLLALAILLSTQVQGSGQHFFSGNDLVTWSREHDKASRGQAHNSFADGTFTGYVAGVFDPFSAYGIICYDGDVSVNQATAIVRKYLENNPEDWSSPAHVIVSTALMQAFPCPD